MYINTFCIILYILYNMDRGHPRFHHILQIPSNKPADRPILLFIFLNKCSCYRECDNTTRSDTFEGFAKIRPNRILNSATNDQKHSKAIQPHHIKSNVTACNTDQFQCNFWKYFPHGHISALNSLIILWGLPLPLVPTSSTCSNWSTVNDPSLLDLWYGRETCMQQSLSNSQGFAMNKYVPLNKAWFDPDFCSGNIQ